MSKATGEWEPVTVTPEMRAEISARANTARADGRSLKQAIFELIRDKGQVSFVNLTEEVEGFRGEYMMEMMPGLVLWMGNSLEASAAIRELIREERIRIEQSTQLVYLIDGQSLRLPLAKRLQSYKEDHWMPTVLNLGPKA